MYLKQYYEQNSKNLKNNRNKSKILAYYYFNLADILTLAKQCCCQLKYNYLANRDQQLLRLAEINCVKVHTIEEEEAKYERAAEKNEANRLQELLRTCGQASQKQSKLKIMFQAFSVSQKITQQMKNDFQITNIYKSVFTIKPLQVIRIMYSKLIDRMIFFIYNCENGFLFLDSMRLKNILPAIPNVYELMKMGLKKELGKRILLSQKNNLIVSVYHKQKPKYIKESR